MVAVTSDDDAQVIPPWGHPGREPGGRRPRLWFRGYRGGGRDRLLAGRAEDC